MTTKTIFTRAILSLAISASLAYTAVSAAEKNIIIDQSVHDYSDDASRSLQSSSSRGGWGGYELKTVLDESYHDYDVSDVASFNSPEPTLERAEFAAFEAHSSAVPSVSFTD